MEIYIYFKEAWTSKR